MKKVVVCLMGSLALSGSYALQYKDLSVKTTAPVAETESPLTGNFDITSNYIFRGISASNNLPAFQGGLTYTFAKPGIYFNVWGSNTSFLAPDGSQATVEIDGIAGIANDITDNWSYDLSFARYFYPKASNANYNEVIGKLTYRILTAAIGYSHDVFNLNGTGIYYNLSVNYDIPAQIFFHQEGYSFSGGIGHYSLDKIAGNSYNDYSLALNKKIKNYTLTLQWTGTNGRNNTPHLDDDHIVGTVLVDF